MKKHSPVCLKTKVYAPLAPGFPSALDALRALPRSASLPVAVVGSGLGGACAPSEANYTQFFEACNGPTVEVDIRDAGQRVDSRGLQISILSPSSRTRLCPLTGSIHVNCLSGLNPCMATPDSRSFQLLGQSISLVPRRLSRGGD